MFSSEPKATNWQQVLIICILCQFSLAVYDYLGCWNDNSSLPQIRLTQQERHSHISLLRQCSKAAFLNGFPVFGVTNNSVCVGSVYGVLTYMRSGPSTKCHNGTGGPNAMDVYSLDGKRTFL